MIWPDITIYPAGTGIIAHIYHSRILLRYNLVLGKRAQLTQQDIFRKYPGFRQIRTLTGGPVLNAVKQRGFLITGLNEILSIRGGTGRPGLIKG